MSIWSLLLITDLYGLLFASKSKRLDRRLHLSGFTVHRWDGRLLLASIGIGHQSGQISAPIGAIWPQTPAQEKSEERSKTRGSVA